MGKQSRCSGVYWKQVRKIERGLGGLAVRGVMGTNPAAQGLWRMRSQLLARTGVTFPRSIWQILKLFGLSPGTIELKFDSEGGWLVVAHTEPGSPPIYHYVDDDIAAQIVKGELDHALEEYLMTPAEPVTY